jgi:hypothetical protein
MDYMVMELGPFFVGSQSVKGLIPNMGSIVHGIALIT